MTHEITDWKFIKDIELDKKNRYLVGQGDDKLLIFDIEKKSH